jgi:ribosomal protein S18 acetylase RimI-like enzyme
LSVLATDGPEIAGYVLAYDDAIAGRVYVGQVGVRQPWRRRGLATAMLSHVMRAAGGVGRTSAALDVDAANPTGAVGVYERVGFETVSRMVTYSRALG